jgi:hypothetical protein
VSPADGVVVAALRAAARGWPVFPLLPGLKTPLIRAVHPAGHPCRGGCGRWGHGYRDAVTDPTVVARWWASWPEANYGIATGAAGLVVVDLDTGKGSPPVGGTGDDGRPRAGVLADQGDTPTPAWIVSGQDVLAWLIQRADGELSAVTDTFTIVTPSGGRHLYYTAPRPELSVESSAKSSVEGGTTVRSSVGYSAGRVTGLGWCIDVRAGGGYVVGPGSRTARGAYRVLHARPPAALPDLLASRLTPSTVMARSPATTAGGERSPHRRLGPGRVRRVESWWAGAVAGELANVAAAIAGDRAGGGRNATVNRAAFKLGSRLAAAGHDTDADVAALTGQLVAAGVAVGLPEREARTAVTSGLAIGRARPRPLPGMSA